jgi:cytidine deaminase
MTQDGAVRCTNSIEDEMMPDVRKLKPTELDPQTRDLYDLAREVSAHAYAPYSKFQVGSAIRTNKGAVFRGCNVENASYGLTCCAERNAVFAAVAAEGHELTIHEVVVYVNAATAAPCGACRQVIAELGPSARVIFSDNDHLIEAVISELLPNHFIQPGKDPDHKLTR